MVGVAFDANCAGVDVRCFMCVADHRREDLERWDIRFNVIAAVHSLLVVFCSGWVQGDHLFGVDGEFLKFVIKQFFECISVDDPQVRTEKEANDFGYVMAEGISFKEYLVGGEPIEKFDVVDFAFFKVRDRF